MPKNILTANGKFKDELFPSTAAKIDLVVDKVYRGGRKGNAGDDPISKIVGVSNQGGFRYLGSPEALKLIVITSNFNDLDWPDNVDTETGILTYFGDNKKPGQELHETPRLGNRLLKTIFDHLHGSPARRNDIPPILVFKSAGEYRDVIFLGLAVPGAQEIDSANDLVAMWKTTKGKRFQNYRALFTILNVPTITGDWLLAIRRGDSLGPNCPDLWRKWVETGVYRPLLAPRTHATRTRAEQTPSDDWGFKLISRIYEQYKDQPFEFEWFSAALLRLMDSNFVSFEVTRPSRDGGRDAIGKYKIGGAGGGILIDCAMEAKCYSPNNAVGVKELSRLISRLRHRQFGVLVTTSYVHNQAYEEIREDGHPIVIVAASDIAEIIKRLDQKALEGLLAPRSGD